MKVKIIFTAAALCIATVACSQNGSKLPDGTDASDLLPSKSQIDSVSYLMGINFGSFIKGYNFGDDLNFSEIKAGMLDFINAEGSQTDTNFVKQFKINPEMMNDIFNDFLAKRAEYSKAYNSAKEKIFFEENIKTPGMQATESGIQYNIVEAGSDVKPGPRDTVLVRYKGALVDGTVFDEVSADQDPIRLTLDRVIPGWQEGMQLIGKGGKATLYIPAALGYGENGTSGIEPNSTLVFDIELVDIFPYVEEVVVE